MYQCVSGCAWADGTVWGLTLHGHKTHCNKEDDANLRQGSGQASCKEVVKLQWNS
jgi:hypothetical protein